MTICFESNANTNFESNKSEVVINFQIVVQSSTALDQVFAPGGKQETESKLH